jgi:hypothetical protein
VAAPLLAQTPPEAASQIQDNSFLIEEVQCARRDALVANVRPRRPRFPAHRWSYDFLSTLQIVPGVAFPIISGTKAIFVYLSFEHPFR